MTALKWDEVGERIYQTGVDRGVLYLKDAIGTAVVWNGLISVEETPSSEVKAYYLDGVKYLEEFLPGDFSGNLKAYTYPDEFNIAMGIEEGATGLFLYDQPGRSFNLSYRTRIGDYLTGSDHAYKVHILYNLFADSDAYTFETIGDNGGKPVEFSWGLTGTPENITNRRPTVHVSLDSEKMSPGVLDMVESILYGEPGASPRCPSIDEIITLINTHGSLIITDNGDGTWTADDAANQYITMLGPNEFEIDHASAVYLDPETYQISTTS